MSKVTVISGPPMTGKTTKAKKLVGDRKAVWTYLQARNQFSEVDFDTEVIVLEGVLFPEQEHIALGLIVSNTIAVTRREGDPLLLPIPEIIITTESNISDLPQGGVFERRVTVIDMLKTIV